MRKLNTEHIIAGESIATGSSEIDSPPRVDLRTLCAFGDFLAKQIP